MRAPVLFLGAMLASVPAVAQQPGDRWEKYVAAFEEAERTAPPPGGEIVFVGSSTIHRWDVGSSIGIKPSPLRWLQIDRMRLANDVIRAICQRDDRLALLDFDTLMLGWDERPRRDLYVEDGFHLSPLGYHIWTAVLRPYLVQP